MLPLAGCIGFAPLAGQDDVPADVCDPTAPNGAGPLATRPSVYQPGVAEAAPDLDTPHVETARSLM